MIELTTPRGLPVQVPETLNEDPSIKFSIGDSKKIREYYDQNGYVVVSGVFSTADCDRVRELWDSEVKPSQNFIYRQATAKAERHAFNSKRWIMNPILNLQSVDPFSFPEFRRFSTQNILTSKYLSDIFMNIFWGEKPKIVQSMYFEGNSATWEHQDSYYLDSEEIGSMAGAWIALEDIAASAGRFFICPESHKIDLGKQGANNNIADNHDVYIQSVVTKMRDLSLQIRAPFLEKGDVLFWNAWTIHGSLDSQDPDRSRSSITCHAIPESHRFLQLQTRILSLQLDEVNGIQVHRPKDLARFRNRVVFALETRFPIAFYGLKRIIIRSMLKRAKKMS
jgi:phytanoyl-CoA hydroxylase